MIPSPLNPDRVRVARARALLARKGAVTRAQLAAALDAPTEPASSEPPVDAAADPGPHG